MGFSDNTDNTLGRVGHGRFTQGCDMNYELHLRGQTEFILHEKMRRGGKGERDRKKTAFAKEEKEKA